MADGIRRRGFASMDPDRRREVAARGGKAVTADKRSFAQDRELAASAGRAGGLAKAKGGFRAPAKRKP